MHTIKCVEYVGEVYDLSLECSNTLFIWKTARGLYRYSHAIKRSDNDTQFDQTIYTFDCKSHEKLIDVTENLARDAAKHCEHLMKYDRMTFIKTHDIKWYIDSICSQYVESADDISTDGSHDESESDDSWTQNNTDCTMVDDLLGKLSEESSLEELSTSSEESSPEESSEDTTMDESVDGINQTDNLPTRPQLSRASKRPCTWIDDTPRPLKRTKICQDCTNWELQHAENQRTIQQLRDKIAQLESSSRNLCIDLTKN